MNMQRSGLPGSARGESELRIALFFADETQKFAPYFGSKVEHR